MGGGEGGRGVSARSVSNVRGYQKFHTAAPQTMAEPRSVLQSKVTNLRHTTESTTVPMKVQLVFGVCDLSLKIF